MYKTPSRAEIQIIKGQHGLLICLACILQREIKEKVRHGEERDGLRACRNGKAKGEGDLEKMSLGSR